MHIVIGLIVAVSLLVMLAKALTVVGATLAGALPAILALWFAIVVLRRMVNGLID